MHPKESGRKPQIREQLGMLSTALAAFSVFILLPFIPSEYKKEAAVTTLGLYGIGLLALKPYLDPRPNIDSTAGLKK